MYSTAASFFDADPSQPGLQHFGRQLRLFPKFCPKRLTHLNKPCTVFFLPSRHVVFRISLNIRSKEFPFHSTQWRTNRNKCEQANDIRKCHLGRTLLSASPRILTQNSDPKLLYHFSHLQKNNPPPPPERRPNFRNSDTLVVISDPRS